MKILICGGGTGGHIYPAMAVVAELQRIGLTAEEFLWIGTNGEIEEELVPRAGLRLETIAGGAVAGVGWRKRTVNLAKMTFSLAKTARLMGEFRPDVLFMTGGYVNGPASLVAWLRRVPAVIYLPDIEPGIAIKVLSRLAKRVACTAESSRSFFRPGSTVVTGYPVRPAMRQATSVERSQALDAFGLVAGRKTVLVFGGSRGARSINRALMAVLPQLLEKVQVIHVSGTLDWPEVERKATALSDEGRRYYRPYAYLHEEMALAFRAADLVVARAGASMLGEGPAFGVPAVLVPYPYAWRYQKVNADYLMDQGAAVRLDDDKLGEQLLPTILGLAADESRLSAMAAAAKALDVPDSANAIARLLLDLGAGKIK